MREHRSMAALSYALLAEAEFRNNGFVGFEVLSFEIFEESLTLTDHLDQATSRHIIVLVHFKMLCELLDSRGQDRHLRLWAANVVLACLRQLNRCRFVLFCNHHPESYQIRWDITSLASRILSPQMLMAMLHPLIAAMAG